MLRSLLPVTFLSVVGMSLYSAPCLPGSLDEYFALGTTGCSVGSVQFADFMAAPGLPFASPIDPAAIQVSPIGTAFSPALLFTLNSSAELADIQQSFFRFSVTGGLTGASISLGSPAATGDGAVTGILDVCSGGLFDPTEPTGCSGVPDTAIAFQIAGNGMPFDSRSFPASSFFDIFVDLTVDAGPSGTASLSSATVGFTAVPEPSALFLTAAGLALIFRRLRHSS